ncbi:hypothetical protein D3C72_597770 [compost metagenome]
MAIVVETRNVDFGHQWRQRGRHCIRYSRHRNGPHRFDRHLARFHVLLRHDQGKHTALPRFAGHADGTAEQRGQIAGDRQAQPGTAVAPIGGAIGLTEGFENAVVLIRLDADPRIADAERDAVIRRRSDGQADTAAFSELHGVGQQVLEHLLQALAVGEQHQRRAVQQVHLEIQVLVHGQRLEQAPQAIDQACHTGVLRTDFQLAGLDFGDVQNVVDQVEQVIAGGVDRLGELHLLGREVFFRVFRQQLGQDQRTVERRAQLVGHVGEEFGLVLARTLQFQRALFELDLRLIEFGVLQVHGVALLSQHLCLLGELFVGLLQLHLLGFQVRLGLLEHPRLFFELLVGGLELFLLHLQLFIELLGFGQHFLQALAIACGLDGRADVAGNQFQQRDIAVIQRTQETQLDHTIDPVVVAGRYHQHTARQTVTEAGADLEIIPRYLVQANQPRLLRHLTDNAFIAVNLLLALFLFAGKTVAGDASETAVVFPNIDRRHGGTEVLRAKLQDVATQQVQAQLSQHLLSELGLAVAQPGLLLQALGTGLLGCETDAVAL